jgi:microcystin-dependent protein
MDEFLAIIKIFAGSYAPTGWAFCDGSLLKITDNTALYALIGTTYGGDGVTTFALPDLRGRIPVGAGYGSNINPITAGQQFGTNAVTLGVNNLPAHNHTGASTMVMQASTDAGIRGLSEDPTNRMLGPGLVYTGFTDNLVNMAQMAATITTANAGQGQSFPIASPSLGINYIICTEGIFPPRP